MPLFRKKPVVIEAKQFSGTNQSAILGWCRPGLSEAALNAAQVMGLPVIIPTMEGEMEASAGDWIIKGIKGEFYPCKPDVFAATYEPVKETK